MSEASVASISSPAIPGVYDVRLAQLGRVELAEALEPLIARLHERLPAVDAVQLGEHSLGLCRQLYGNARSGDALPVARAVLAQAELSRNAELERKAAIACGLLAADMADIVTAVEFHVRSLRLAAGDRIGMCVAWNNLGLAMAVAANYEMAGRCYQRALALVEGVAEPVYQRYVVSANLAQSHFMLGAYGPGLHMALSALEEQTAAFREQDLQSALLLQRNLVRLLVATGRIADAQNHVVKAVTLAERVQTPRAMIAASTTRAVYELATGHSDVALTRLDKALARARELPSTLRETLGCIIQAEEQAGHVERALMRLGELSDHTYRAAVERAREHIELAGLAERAGAGVDQQHEQSRARLVAKVDSLSRPEGWGALERLGVTAVMRIDATGWHGKRVGTLAKALAIASGVDPLQALEIGLAAEIHDIGMLSVPDEILSKKATLTPAERRMVRRHAEAGAEMLSDDSHARVLMAREMAQYHHAHWDGSGHPERVGGKLIPLPARICAVADAYDAMVCGIGGRAPKGMEAALAELRRCAGGQFDPQLVQEFESLVRMETEDIGLDLSSNAGMEDLQELVNALQEDRGFV
jgi:putative two-component system response regulator